MKQINFQDQIKEILVCKYCTFETENIDELDNHILDHETKCEDIESDCESVVVDTPPKKRVKKNVPDSYKCPYCSYETKRKHDLPKHLLTHSTPETTTIYKCSQCPYETKRKNDMPKHMLAHCTNVQMFKCPDCPYQTKRKSDLPKHLLCHKPCGEVPLYKCDFCEYVTKRKGDLPKHILNHKDGSTIKLYDCTECDYKTKRKNDLHKHMLVHCDRHVAGVFKCLKCPYATDKVNKFSKHALSGCRYCDNPISTEHIMLEDLIGSIEQDIIMVEVDEEAEDYEPLSYIQSQEVEENEEFEVEAKLDVISEASSENIVENQYARYKEDEEMSKVNYRETVRKKHGVFKINVGEFSYETQNLSQDDSIKQDHTISQD